MATPVFTAFGISKAAGEWADDPRCAVPLNTLDWRLRQGWDPETAITAPAHSVQRGARTLTAYGVTKQLASWLDDPWCAVSLNTLKKRLADGWTPEAALSTPARSGTPLTEQQEAELRDAAEKVRRSPKVRRHTPPEAPEAAAMRARDDLIRAAVGRGTALSEIGRAVGLSGTRVGKIRDRSG